MVEKATKVIVAADKTSNFYKVEPKQYQELVKKYVEMEYKKETARNVKKVNKAHKTIVNKLEIEDRVFKTMERECFITIKDHKYDFRNNPKCRLINTTKPELGKVSKKTLTKVLEILRKKTRLNQWKNVYAVIDWFEKLENKKEMVFIVFDVVNYYPSITLELLEKAIDWAKQFVNITDEEIEILKETKKSLHFIMDAIYASGVCLQSLGRLNF